MQSWVREAGGQHSPKLWLIRREKIKTGVQVVLIGRSEQAMAECSQTRENSKYFPGMKLPENLEFTADAPTGLTGADLVVLALPSQVLRSQLQLYARYIEPHALLVSLAKGIRNRYRFAHVPGDYRGT